MRESRTPGSVRGAPGDGRPYRDSVVVTTRSMSTSGEWLASLSQLSEQAFALHSGTYGACISVRTGQALASK